MKKSKIFIFFFFNLLIINICISTVTATTSPSTAIWDSANVDNTWLKVDVSNFIDYTTSDGSGQIRFSEGGHSLESFRNEGILTQSSSRIAFKADGIFTFQINAYTTVTPETGLSGFRIGESSSKYLEIRRFTAENIFPPPARLDEELKSYSVTYDTVYYSGIIKHDYDGYLPVSVSIVPDWSGQDILLNGYQIQEPKIYVEIKGIEVVETRHGQVGSYEDKYVQQSTTEGTVTATKIGKQDPTLVGDKHMEMLGTINDANLGWSLGQMHTSTLQQYTINAEPVGTYLASIGSNKYSVPIRLKPEYTETKQEINIRYGRLWWDYQDVPLISPAGIGWEEGPITKIDNRIASVHVDNYFVHQKFKVYVNFICSATITNQQGGSDLDDPYVENGDWIWDANVGGETDVDVLFERIWSDLLDDIATGFIDAFGIIITIVIIVAVIIVVIKVAIPLMSIRKITKRG